MEPPLSPAEASLIYPTQANTEIPSIFLVDSNGRHQDPNNAQHCHHHRSSADLAQEQLWKDMSAMYSANEIAKKDALKLDSKSSSKNPSGDGDSKAQKLDQLLVSFMNGANAVLDELSFLGYVHPAIAVVIVAFQQVIKVDIARRENDKKVLVVIVQMQSMLGPMFQLRNLDRSRMAEEYRVYHEKRLTQLAKVVARDINQCRSDVMHFLDHNLLHKLVRAMSYEKKFAAHIEIFSQRRAELQLVISEYIAIGVNTSNITHAEVGDKVKIIDAKLDTIISVIFRNLDTPHEKDVFKFIDQCGGPVECVKDRALFSNLVTKAGRSSAASKNDTPDSTEIEDLRVTLSNALKEDFDEVLEKHYLRFEKLLQVQNNNMKHVITLLEDQGVSLQTYVLKLDKIYNSMSTTITILKKGSFLTQEVKLKDPEIHKVWNQMRLGNSSVKAKLFVLTLRDYIRAANSTLATILTQGSVSLPITDEEATTPVPIVSQMDNPFDSEWVFEFIDVAYVQPIIEAMDEDCSGFISVEEANNFALSRDRPKNMKLLDWIAYWAAGWHINLIQCQSRIYSMLLQMYEALPSVHIGNRTGVNRFLNTSVIKRIEALCRSLKPLPSASRRNSRLQAVANEVASWQMEQLNSNLREMGFVIESPFVATAISGSSRIETWIFPTLDLLLQRFLQIINLSKTMILACDEFKAHFNSLFSVFSVFDERREILEAKFSQLDKDVDAQFLKFSYGMFYAAHKAEEFDMSLNTLLSQRTGYFEQELLVKGKGTQLDTSILSRPPANAVDLSALQVDLLPSSPPPPEHVSHPIEGSWFGWSAPYTRPLRCLMHPVIDNKLVGKGEAFFGSINISGTVSPVPETDGKIKVNFSITVDSHWDGQVCEGFYDPVRDIIDGTYEWEDLGGQDDDDDDDDDDEGEKVFHFTRTPAHLFRFRNYLDGPAPVSSWENCSQARRRWAFAIEAVLYETRRPEKAMTQGLAERRLWLYYAVKYDMHDTSITESPTNLGYLSTEEFEAYDAMASKVQPDIARIWEETALFMARRETYLVANTTCDRCGVYTTFCRYQCIECTGMRGNIIQSVDFCQDCFDKAERVDENRFVHLPTHSLLCSRTWVHTYEMNSLINAARLASKQCKKKFRDMENSEGKTVRRTGKIMKGKISRKITIGNSEGSSKLVEHTVCVCCGEQVSLPCLICIECFPLVFICTNCDHKKAWIRLSEHSVLKHHLLFIRDSNEVKTVDANQSEIEHQLNELNTSVLSLDIKVDSQLRDLRTIVRNMAKTIGAEELSSSSVFGSDDEENRLLQEEDAILKPSGNHKVDDNPVGPSEEMQSSNSTEAAETEEKMLANQPNVNHADKQVEGTTHSSLHDRLASLETRVDSILNHLAKDEHKIDALEAKIDQKLGALLSLLQSSTSADATHLVPNV